MGRPKMRDLCCNICNKAFKRKKFLEEHMESHLDIKIEPDDDSPEYKKFKNKKSIKKKILQVKIPRTKCSVCGIRFKGEKGLKIHMSVHKRSPTSSCNDASPKKNKKVLKINMSATKQSYSNFCNDASPSKNKKVGVHNQSAPGNASLNKSASVSCLQFQNATVNYNSKSKFQDQPNNSNFEKPVSFVESLYQMLSDNIPKFDCDSERYLKWLKGFVTKCTMLEIPLDHNICKQINVVAHDLSDALGNPQNSLKLRENHYFFRRIYIELSEIMLRQLKHHC